MLPEEVTQFIGQAREINLEVEKGAIRRFADAIEDDNPLYWDEEYAKRSRYGSLLAPPGFFGWPAKWTKGGPLFTEIIVELGDRLAKLGYNRLLDGGERFEFFHPVRAGDILTASLLIKDITEREGKEGKAAFLITETTYTNQKGALAAKVRRSAVYVSSSAKVPE